jgi:hypothetical protein
MTDNFRNTRRLRIYYVIVYNKTDPKGANGYLILVKQHASNPDSQDYWHR